MFNVADDEPVLARGRFYTEAASALGVEAPGHGRRTSPARWRTSSSAPGACSTARSAPRRAGARAWRASSRLARGRAALPRRAPGTPAGGHGIVGAGAGGARPGATRSPRCRRRTRMRPRTRRSSRRGRRHAGDRAAQAEAMSKKAVNEPRAAPRRSSAHPLDHEQRQAPGTSARKPKPMTIAPATATVQSRREGDDRQPDAPRRGRRSPAMRGPAISGIRPSDEPRSPPPRRRTP